MLAKIFSLYENYVMGSWIGRFAVLRQISAYLYNMLAKRIYARPMINYHKGWRPQDSCGVHFEDSDINFDQQKYL